MSVRRACEPVSPKALADLGEIDAELRSERAKAQTLLDDLCRRWLCLVAMRGLIEEELRWQQALGEGDETSAVDQLAKKIALHSRAEQNLSRECGHYAGQAFRALVALRQRIHALRASRRQFLECGFRPGVERVQDS